MDRRRAAGVLLALAACVAYATAAPTASNHTSLDLYDGTPDGCYYNFQRYGEGDRIMTNEPCLNCTCHNRMLMCYLRVCPFTKPIGQDCTIEKRADQCCPIVTCPDVPVDLLTSTTTSPAEYGATGLGKLDKFGCSIHGKYFPEGSKVPPTPNKPCEHCYCIRNMTTCVMQECTLHVDGCTPIYHKDVCCPVRYSCDHPEDEMPLLDDLSTTVRPTPGFLLTTTTLSPVTQMSQDCLYENQIISDGALIKTEKACDHCYCMKGDIVCVVQECGTPMENEGKNCTALAPREGVCCPDTYICEGDESTTGTYEADYTTELEKLTTLSPPRRAGSEGSGYRIEPDVILNTEPPTFETETEGSGYEQATIHPSVVTTASPDSHKIEPSDETLSSTVEPSELNTISTTKELITDHVDIITESNVQKDTELPITTSTYISPQVDESSTAKAQEEDIGSGEEEIETPYERVPISSALPAIEKSKPTVASEQTVATTQSYKADDSRTPDKEPTTIAPIIDEDRITIPKEHSASTEDNIIDITTETRRHLAEDEGVEASTTFDEEYHITEHDLLQTTSVPIIDENEIKASTSPEQDKKTFEPQNYSTPISAPGLEDEVATTESQDDITDSFEGTVADFDVHHQITMTASTPLLEEIEKDTTDQESIHETTPDNVKTSTASSNLPTQETIIKDSLKPDLIDETISTNIPTIDQQKTQETDADESLEPQQHAPTTSAPVFEDEIKKTTPSDTMTTSKIQDSQETDVDQSTSQQYIPTTSAPAFEDEFKKITPSDTMATSKTQESQENDVQDSSESQQYATTTSAPVFDNEVKKTTQYSDTMTTSKTQEGQIPDVEESSEPQVYAPTTSASVFEDEVLKTTLSDTMATSKTQEGQKTDVEESSESQQYAPTTIAPVFEDDVKKTTPSDTMTTSKTQEGQITDVEESSEPQQYAPSTGAPVFEDEVLKTTPSDTMATSKTQQGEETDVEESSEPQQYAPITNAPVFEVEVKKTTPSDTMTTPKTQEEGEGTDVKESSEPQQYAPTTSAPVFEDEINKTTPSNTMTTSKTQEAQDTDIEESSEPQKHTPTTISSVFEDEVMKTTPSDVMTSSKTQESQEIDVDESSETQQYAPTTSAPAIEDEVKKTTPSDTMTTSKTQDGPITDVEESSEPQQYAPTTSSPAFEDEVMKITPSDTMATSKAQEGQEKEVEESSDPEQYAPTTSAHGFDDETKKTTAEPDKGLNTIPSGSVEEEITESPGIQKYTHTDDIVPTESATELENKLGHETEAITNTAKYTTLLPDISASLEDQLTQTTESTVKENVDKIVSTESHEINEHTTVLADTPEEAISTLVQDHHSSTKLPSSEYQESTTAPVPLNTENNEQTYESGKPTTTSIFEYSTQAPGAEESTPEKYETITSSAPYVTVPAPTTADFDENEIVNESRIPGEGDCLLNGVTYRNESAVPSINKCQSDCRCSSSIIKCDPIICSPPPEYMDNCQTTYDSLDSCCPTYVCDHKTETMPPQSHSQMSGTEAPIDSPVICNGDECVLNENKKHPVETSELCESGSCTNEGVTSSRPFNIPEQPTIDRHEGCTGNKCTSYDSADQLCSEENGCQASPVKPCEGTECEVTSDAIPPQKQQPCVGDNCDYPVKDCSGGKCATDEDEDKLDIEKECTEKSCKRKDDSELEHEPPKMCTGSECQSTELTSDMELTTDDSLGIVTDKIETSSTSPSTEIIQGDIVSKPLLTTTHPDVTTKLPDLDSIKDKISTIYESATPSENQESPVSYLPETTNVSDDEIGTSGETNLPDVNSTDKLEYDVTTKAANKIDTESPDLSLDKESTTETAEEIRTQPPEIHTTKPQEVTKLPLEINNQDATTDIISHETEQQTTPPEKQMTEGTAISILEEMVTKPSETLFTGSSEADDDSVRTEPSEVTKSPTEPPKANEDIVTTSKTYDFDSNEATKPPQTTSASEDVTTPIADIIDAETLEPLVDLEEITKTPKEPQGEGTTAKSTDEFVTQPEISNAHETTISPEGSLDITKHHHEETLTKASTPFDSEKIDVGKSTESTHSETTTTLPILDVDIEASKPSDTDVQEVTQSPKETDSEEATSKTPEEIGIETSKPLDTELQATILPSKTENEETTKKSTITEPSPVIGTEEQKYTKSPETIEFTTVEGTDETTEPSKRDEISHRTTISQQDIETDVTVSKHKDETTTELSKPDESELLGSTTKSSFADFNSEETTAKVTKETDAETISDNLEPQAVTQSSESDSLPLSDKTTTKPSDDDQQLFSESHSPEKSSTSQHDTVTELTTQSMLLPDSKSKETEKTSVYEITTRITEQSKPTESITESASEPIDEGITISSLSTNHKEDDVTSIYDHNNISTESPLDLVTKPQPHSEVTASPDKPSEDGETTATDIETSTSDKTATELPKTHVTETLDAVPPTSIYEDNKIQEDTKTEVPNLLDNETIPEKTTYKPSDTTDVSYAIDLKTEQPEPIDSPKEDEQPTQTLDETTKIPSALEKATTESLTENETKLPVDSELKPDSHTDKPYIHGHGPDTSEEDKLTTVEFEDKSTEKATGIEKESETTQYQHINTTPTESLEETYTKIPLQSSYEATDVGVSHTSEQSDDKESLLTTPTIKSSELTTEPSNIVTNIPTETSSSYNGDTGKTTLESEVTEQIITESSSSRDGTEDRETQTISPEIFIVQESSTEEPPKENEAPEENTTTAFTETEKVYESVTESVTKDNEVKTPEPAFEPSQPGTTISVEDITKAQDQGDSENVEEITKITTSKAPESIETSTEHLEIISSPPGEDIETSTPKQELAEATSGKTEGESASPIDKESIETPVTAADQETVEIITEPQNVLIETATKKQETATELMGGEFITSKPEIYPTLITSVEESAKLTPSPVEEGSTASEQTLTSSVESHVTDEEQSVTVFDLDKVSTPKIPEIEEQTEKATTPTKSPLHPELSPVTSATEEEKLTTAKSEEFSTASPVINKFTKPTHKPTEAPATEQPRPIPTEEQPTDDLLAPDEEPSIPTSGTSGYGTDPDYMEEDQTFGPGTCRYGGKVYVSAQQIPRDDPCDFCFCFRSDIICLQQSCPPPIHGCHEEPISGFCCPRYECPVSMATTVNVTTTTTTTTTTLPPHFPVHSYKGSAQKRGCLIKGHTYKVGEVVRASSGPCLHCTCGGDGQMKCDPKQCTPEPMLRQMIAAAVSAKRRR